MSESIYKIRPNFLLPLGLVTLLSLTLFGSAIYLTLPKAKIIILATFLLPVCIIFLESARRRVHIGDNAVRVDKLLRRKVLNYNELTAVDTIVVRKRVFLSLSSENDFVILSNSYDNFAQLIDQLLQKVPATVISDETRQLANNPPRKCSDIFSAWLAVAVLALIIYVQFRGF